jgi:hypothetical protein
LRGTATALPYGSPVTTGSGMVSAVAAVSASGQTAGAAAGPVSAGFASGMYPLIYGQPFSWHDLTFNGGADSNGIPWSQVSWSNVVWDAVTWQNVNWESFNWSAVNWQDIAWEDIAWEGITWEDIAWESVPGKDKGRKGHGGGKVLD